MVFGCLLELYYIAKLVVVCPFLGTSQHQPEKDSSPLFLCQFLTDSSPLLSRPRQPDSWDRAGAFLVSSPEPRVPERLTQTAVLESLSAAALADQVTMEIKVRILCGVYHSC